MTEREKAEQEGVLWFKPGLRAKTKEDVQNLLVSASCGSLFQRVCVILRICSREAHEQMGHSLLKRRGLAKENRLASG